MNFEGYVAATSHGTTGSTRPDNDASRFLWVGNHPGLDFLNTRPRRGGKAVEELGDGASLLAWLAESGLVSGAELSPFERGADALDGVAERARLLRETIRQVVADHGEGRPLADAMAEELNELLRPGRAYLSLQRRDQQLQRVRAWDLREPEHLLVPIAECALSLLTDIDPNRISRCGDKDCVLLFYDTSKNRSRRWCSMQACGNRHKAARHRQGRR